MKKRLILIGGISAVLTIGPLAGMASAQTIEEVATAANEMWPRTGGSLPGDLHQR